MERGFRYGTLPWVFLYFFQLLGSSRFNTRAPGCVFVVLSFPTPFFSPAPTFLFSFSPAFTLFLHFSYRTRHPFLEERDVSERVTARQLHSQDENSGPRCLHRLSSPIFCVPEGAVCLETCICKGRKSTGDQEETPDLKLPLAAWVPAEDEVGTTEVKLRSGIFLWQNWALQVRSSENGDPRMRAWSE